MHIFHKKLRDSPLLPYVCQYSTPATEIKLGTYDIKDPLNVNSELIKLGIHSELLHHNLAAAITI